MDLREEYERFQKAQQEAPKLIAKAQAYGSTTSDRARAAAARRDADPERMLKKIAEARAKEARDIDRLVPSELQHALLALMRLEINNLLPHPLRGLTECYTDDEAPLVAKLDAQGQAYWGEEVGSGGLTVAGTPELFKVCALTGWTLDSEGEWTQMSIADMVASPPTELWEGQTEAGNYLRPTWDWVRAYEET